MDSWYIEGKDENAQTFSCSFVEFDGRGDYIDFNQHRAAWTKVKELSDAQKILLVFYCHGWKNNSQSGDVLEFNEFLGRLSASPFVGAHGYRVHGVYLSWRGNLYRPTVDKSDANAAFARTTNQFGEPIVNPKHHRRFSWTHKIPEALSYWGRRNAAEHKVSSVPIARTIFTCASLAKSMDRHKGREGLLQSSRVMVMGHSFGALLLERAMNSTCLDPLTDQWAWFEGQSAADKDKTAKGEMAPDRKMEVNPLPIDFVLFVNSAAPAIYCKTMRDFLTAHHRAMRRANSPYADTPVFMSLTSSADAATRYMHPIGNLLARFAPSLQHTYENNGSKEVTLLKIPPGSTRSVHQSVFYNRTPGHQPLLVDHWIVDQRASRASAPRDRQTVFNANLDYHAGDPFSFYAQSPKKPDEVKLWRLSRSPSENDRSERKWASQFGSLISNRSTYWIIRCDNGIIRDHNDVWSDSAMQTYAALYRLVEWSRIPENREKVRDTFDAYWNGNTQTFDPD